MSNSTISVTENGILSITMITPKTQLKEFVPISPFDYIREFSKVILAAIHIRHEHCYKELLAHLSEVTYDGFSIRWKGGHFSPKAFEAMETVITQLAENDIEWMNHISSVVQVIKALAMNGRPKDISENDWETLTGLLIEHMLILNQQRS